MNSKVNDALMIVRMDLPFKIRFLALSGNCTRQTITGVLRYKGPNIPRPVNTRALAHLWEKAEHRGIEMGAVVKGRAPFRNVQASLPDLF